MTAPTLICELVERFKTNKASYKSQGYNEAQLRREFIDPMFRQLGWDMDNTSGYAEAYKDVIHEDTLKIGTTSKAPDYAFRVGGARKFFLEAKKPAINVAEDKDAAYQYAWSAKLQLSVLTNFEGFAAYDCRTKPEKDDKSSVARIMYVRFEDFPQKWHEINAVFSREAILKGSFDKYATDATKKRGTTEVDDAFLEDIEQWRETLSRNIHLRNPQLGVRDLNAAVQKLSTASSFCGLLKIGVWSLMQDWARFLRARMFIAASARCLLRQMTGTIRGSFISARVMAHRKHSTHLLCP